jgi:hypothetical protein
MSPLFLQSVIIGGVTVNFAMRCAAVFMIVNAPSVNLYSSECGTILFSNRMTSHLLQ